MHSLKSEATTLYLQESQKAKYQRMFSLSPKENYIIYQ